VKDKVIYIVENLCPKHLLNDNLNLSHASYRGTPSCCWKLEISYLFLTYVDVDVGKKRLHNAFFNWSQVSIVSLVSALSQSFTHPRRD